MSSRYGAEEKRTGFEDIPHLLFIVGYSNTMAEKRL